MILGHEPDEPSGAESPEHHTFQVAPLVVGRQESREVLQRTEDRFDDGDTREQRLAGADQTLHDVRIDDHADEQDDDERHDETEARVVMRTRNEHAQQVAEHRLDRRREPDDDIDGQSHRQYGGHPFEERVPQTTHDLSADEALCCR